MAYATVDSADVDNVMERTLLIKQEAFVFKIPGSQVGDDQKGWKADGWNLDKPEWKGKLRLITRGTRCVLKLEEKGGGHKSYACVEVDTYPGPSVQPVTDSSRYFVVKTSAQDHAGLGFADRNDSFDLNVALQDHFKSLLTEAQLQKESEEPNKKLDLALKEGQTIKVNINMPRKSGRERSRSPAVNRQNVPAPTPEMIAAGIVPPPPKEMDEPSEPAPPRIDAPPARQANPNWIQF